jgi:hypothetical protein
MQKIKTLLFLSVILSFNLYAHNHMSDTHNEGKEIHNETCVECHMGTHDKDFYTSETRTVDSMFKLKSQVSRCSQFFDTGWFPKEEKAVLDYLNHEFYKFEQK